MRTLNVRLAIILLAIVVIGGAGFYFVHRVQRERSAKLFLDQAEIAKKEVEAAKKDKKTEEEYKALKKQFDYMRYYLVLKPDDWDVMEELGKTQADYVNDRTTFGQAYNMLDKVVREDPKRNEARKKLIGLLMLAEYYTDALTHIKYLLKESPDDPELLQYMGKCAIATREYENAQQAFEKIIEHSPKQVDTYPQLALVLNKGLDKPKLAYECMQNMIKNNTDSAKAYVYLGNYWEGINSLEEAKKITDRDTDPREEAMKAAEKALEIAPDDEDALLLAARCSLGLNKLDEAKNFTERNLKAHKDSPLIYIMLAEITWHSNKQEDREKAIEILDEGIKQTKDSPQVLLTKANYLIELKRLDEAKAALEKLQTAPVDKARLDFLEAKIAFAQKEWADAIRRFEKVRPALVQWPSLVKQTDLYLGDCYGQLRNVDQQISAFQRVLKADPFNVPARQGLTNAYMASGRVDDAVNEYDKIIKTQGISPAGYITIAALLIRQNIQRPVGEQKWDQVEKILDEADKANPDSYQIVMLRTEMLHARNRDSDAEKLLQEAHEKNPKQIDILRTMASLAALQKKWEQAEKILADYEKVNGDSPDVRLARSEYYLRRYENKAGEYMAKLGENIDGFSSSERIRLWNGLLNDARRVGDGKLAKQYVDLIAQNDANNLEVQFLRLEDAANNQDTSAMEEILKDVNKVEGEGPVWYFGQARLSALRAMKENKPVLLDEAAQYLEKALALRPMWSKASLFMGSICDQQKKFDQALKYYQDALDKGERSTVAIRRMVQILMSKQRSDDVGKLFSQLDRMQIPITSELTRLWVSLLFQQNQVDLAVEKARQSVAEKSEDYKDHIWLGQIQGMAARQAKNKKRDKDYATLSADAEKSLRRAVELKGDEAETWVALVGFLNSIDKSKEAEDVINQAQEKIPADKAPIALARCYEATNKNDLALEQYKLALAAKPNDPTVIRGAADFYQRIGKTADAETLLKLITDGKVKVDETAMYWARRQLAGIVASKGGSINMEEARKLIEQNLAASGGSADDLRIKARLSSIDPRRSRKDEAIELLSKIVEKQQATPDDRFNLAVLYLAADRQSRSQASSSAGKGADGGKSGTDWIKARNILRDLISAQDADPRYLAIYVDALVEHGEVSDAETYLNKLVKDFPRSVTTIVLQSQIMARHNQFDESLELMKSFVDMKDAMPADRSLRIYTMAQGIEDIAGQMKKNPEQKIMAEHFIKTAEMFFRQYVDERPSQSMEMATFFIRQDQIEDAVNFLEQTWKNSNPVSIAQVCMSIFQRGKKTKELAQRLEKVLADASDAFEERSGLQLALADVRVMQGRYEEAEGIYRGVLDKQPDNVLAMNNLAVLLTMENKKLDEALRLVNKAIEIYGPLASMLDTRGCVYIAQGNADKAISNLAEAVADSPLPVRLFHQAQALNLGNQKYAATMSMQQALKAGLTKEMLEPPEFPAYEKLLKIAQEQGAATDDKKASAN